MNFEKLYKLLAKGHCHRLVSKTVDDNFLSHSVLAPSIPASASHRTHNLCTTSGSVSSTLDTLLVMRSQYPPPFPSPTTSSSCVVASHTPAAAPYCGSVAKVAVVRRVHQTGSSLRLRMFNLSIMGVEVKPGVKQWTILCLCCPLSRSLRS